MHDVLLPIRPALAHFLHPSPLGRSGCAMFLPRLWTCLPPGAARWPAQQFLRDAYVFRPLSHAVADAVGGDTRLPAVGSYRPPTALGLNNQAQPTSNLLGLPDPLHGRARFHSRCVQNFWSPHLRQPCVCVVNLIQNRMAERVLFLE